MGSWAVGWVLSGEVALQEVLGWRVEVRWEGCTENTGKRYGTPQQFPVVNTHRLYNRKQECSFNYEDLGGNVTLLCYGMLMVGGSKVVTDSMGIL